VQLRIYLAPDKDGKIPWTEWFESYNLFFNNEKLAWPDILVEIKAVAVKKRAN
jgi:hypothetical protein